MAQQLDDFVFADSRGRRSYPWNDWLNGKPWRLKRGVDFHGKVTSFQQLASSHAVRRGLFVRSCKESDDTVVIQAFSKHDVLSNGKPE